MPPYRNAVATPSLRARQKAATRELIVDAAVLVFTDRGYEDSRIDEIAARAGTSRATFYLHFRRKSDLLFELARRAEHYFESDYRELADLLRDPEVEEIRCWIARGFGCWVAAAALMRPVFEAADRDRRLANQLLPDVLPGARPLARALVDAAVCPDESTSEAMAMVFMAPLFVAFRRRAFGRPIDEDRLAVLVAQSWNALAVEHSRKPTSLGPVEEPRGP